MKANQATRSRSRETCSGASDVTPRAGRRVRNKNVSLLEDVDGERQILVVNLGSHLIYCIRLPEARLDYAKTQTTEARHHQSQRELLPRDRNGEFSGSGGGGRTIRSVQPVGGEADRDPGAAEASHYSGAAPAAHGADSRMSSRRLTTMSHGSWPRKTSRDTGRTWTPTTKK